MEFNSEKGPPTPELERSVDVLVVGSGGGGMVAALRAKQLGLDVLLVEKQDQFGGSTVLSGGSIWIPNAPAMVKEGASFDPAGVRSYLESITEGKVSSARIEQLVTEGPEMLKFLETSPHLSFIWRPRYPDYFPNAPGGSAVGRSIEAIALDRRELGRDNERMVTPNPRLPRGMWITSDDLHTFLSIRRSWSGKAMFLRLISRAVNAKLTGAQIATRGEALIGRLLLALRDADATLWPSSPLTDLLVDDDGRVTGAVVRREDRDLRIVASAVIIASGGFDHDLERRKAEQPLLEEDWSLGAPGNLGDGIRLGEKLGAATDLLDDAWWMPAVPWKGRSPGLLLFERQMPGQLIVNGAGVRFTNEAAPYTDFVHDMFRGEEAGVSHIPSWLIFDESSWRSAMIAGHLPLPKLPAPVPTGWKLPKEWLDSGAVKVASNLTGLAAEIGVPADALEGTVERFNELARRGRDDDFHRGDSAYDNYYGDPRLPNPNLAEVKRAPYYAFAIVPADLGTKGGLVTDENARVLREDGSPIPGLYATGNATASVMGHSYAGPGGTIGPSMTFGFVAANHAAASLEAAVVHAHRQ